MEIVTVSLPYDDEKLSALRLYLGEKNLQVEDELTKSLDALYAKTVPQSVRQYLSLRAGGGRLTQQLKKNKPGSQAPEGEATHYGEQQRDSPLAAT